MSSFLCFNVTHASHDFSPSFQPKQSETKFTLNGSLEYLDQTNSNKFIPRFSRKVMHATSSIQSLIKPQGYEMLSSLYHFFLGGCNLAGFPGSAFGETIERKEEIMAQRW